jgi:tetratricopeptide (TPR) repeat protein/tRNA A-37 threonylcarbamoyl transferase component Bud32
MEAVCPNCRCRVDVASDANGGAWICSKCGLPLEEGVGATLTLSRDQTPARDEPEWMAGLCQSIGRFKVLCQIGSGGYGIVYKAFDSELRRMVAIKVPRRHTADSAADRQRLLREAQSVSQLHHPAIVPIYDVGQTEGFPYIVSEFVRGTSLDLLLQRRKFSCRESAELIARAADGLDTAHVHGVVHRDIKPSNIMIEGEDRPRLMDFGLARQEVVEETLTQDGLVVGTPAYMSPEQAAGRFHTLDRRTDVYSLGTVLYELLTGERPFRGNMQMMIRQLLHEEPRNPRRLNNDIPRDLETICQKAMEKSPELRYQTAQEFADDLRRWLRNEPILARRVGPVGRGYRWCRRNPVMAALSTVTVVLVLAIAVGTTASFFWISAARRERREADAMAARNLQDLRQTFDQYYKLISENPLLDDPAAQPLLQQILGRAKNDCQQFLARYGDRPELAAEAGAMWFRLEQLQLADDDTDAARLSTEKQLDCLERLLERHPTLEQLKPLTTELFHFPRFVRGGMRAPSDPKAALALAGRKAAIWDRLAAEHPEVPAIQHDRAGVYYLLSLACRAAGDQEGAFRAIEKAITISTKLAEVSPENREYRREMSQFESVEGDIDFSIGRVEAGLARQEHAAKTDPENPRPHHCIALALLTSRDPKVRDPKRAVRFAQEALAIEPRNPEYWYTLGVARYLAGQFPDALESFNRAMLLQKDGGDARVWYFAAMTHWQLGHKLDARVCFDKAAKEKNHIERAQLAGLDEEAARLLGVSAASEGRVRTQTFPNSIFSTWSGHAP